MRELIQTENPKYKRDLNSKALLATHDENTEYRVQKKSIKRINDLETRVDSLDQKLDLLLNHFGLK